QDFLSRSAAARDRPRAIENAGGTLPPAQLDRLGSVEVQRARLALVVGAQLIAETLADRGNRRGSPRNRALLEANELAFGFRLDFAVTLGRVERIDGAE